MIVGSRTQVDEKVMRQVLNGRPHRALTEAERQILVQWFFHAGWSSRRTAAELGVTQRTVTRVLKKLGLAESDRNIHPGHEKAPPRASETPGVPE